MQILENQSLYSENLISYICKIDKNTMLDLASHVYNNVSFLAQIKGEKKIVTINNIDDPDNMVECEVLIPLQSPIENNENYQLKKYFRLIHAVKIRHEGSIKTLSDTENFLNEYIKMNSFQPITNFYYVIIRNDPKNTNDNIIDIYVGINYNIL